MIFFGVLGGVPCGVPGVGPVVPGFGPVVAVVVTVVAVVVTVLTVVSVVTRRRVTVHHYYHDVHRTTPLPGYPHHLDTPSSWYRPVHARCHSGSPGSFWLQTAP